MREAASNLEFEKAARLRDEIRELEQDELGIGPAGPGDYARVSRHVVGRSNEGKPGTRKTRYGKSQKFKSSRGR